jgi:heme-degrading monooxygenase HmoA
MILELADIKVQAGKEQEFGAAIKKGVKEVISKARGYIGHQINHGIEDPQRWVLMIYWETLEHHTVDFRGSPAFAEWRSIVGPYFAQPPVVEHFNLAEKNH